MRFSKGKIIVLVVTMFAVAYTAMSKDGKYPFGNTDRDPFSALVTNTGQLLVRKKIGPTGFILKGIIYSSVGKSLAVIDDEVFKENDIIGNYKIVKIGKKKVLLKKDKELIVLKLEDNNEENKKNK